MQSSFSYWEQTQFINYADVIIIGSGIVGLSAALHLATRRPQIKVLVLERGFLPVGASTKNAGFACFGTVSEQLAYLRQSSEEEVMRLAAYKWRGLQKLRQNLGDEAIAFQQPGGYDLFRSDEKHHAEACFDHLTYFNKMIGQAIGHTDIYADAGAKIAGFGFNSVEHMIVNRYEGQLNTGKMMRALLHKVYSTGTMVLNNCSVEQIQNDGADIALQTNQGIFKTRKVILATNAFAAQLYPELDVVPGRGQVLVTQPVPDLKLNGTYHFNQGYYYFRNIDGRVLFGGGRNLDLNAEQTYEQGHTETVRQQLLQYLHEMILPAQNVEVDYWWSGIMGFGEELKPIIKQIQPGVFCAVRCNGMGVAMGSLVGEEVAEMLISN